ncbi:hypothetical protein D3Z55_24020 [Clostridiaceae bacterium]|nr:hypothetical protein [Clostridiaceae bacterium]
MQSKPEVAVSVRPGVYKMPMARMPERAGQSAIVRVSKKNGANPPFLKGSQCGRVKIPPLKFHASLQAAASWQVHSRNLRASEQIAVSERGESLSRISWANMVYRLSNHISSRSGG